MTDDKNNDVYETGPIDHKLQGILALERFKESRSSLFASLTAREKQVLALVAQGGKSAEVAARLHISTVTAQNHRASIRQKLGISSDVEYLKYAFAFDLIPF